MLLAACRGALCVLLVAGAVVDARERRFPNALAIALAGAGALCALAAGGVPLLVMHACAAVAVCGALLAFELWWRRRRGTAGQGMGDLKALGALMVAAPVTALASYAGALLALGLACMATGRRALPLVPFLAPAFIVASAVGGWL